MAHALIEGRGLSRKLDGERPVWLVREADIQIERGEFVCITGPSGSGKSSLLYLLGLIDRPSGGELRFDGQSLADYDDDALAQLRLERLGFVFQFHFLLGEFTALENVLLPMQKLGRLNTQAMADHARKILTDLGLGDQMTKYPSQMSGGQRQRVAVGRALANDPDVILADEPTGNLDTKSAQAVFDLFRDIVAQGRSVVAVTHEMNLAEQADRIVRIVDGRIESDGR